MPEKTITTATTTALASIVGPHNVTYTLDESTTTDSYVVVPHPPTPREKLPHTGNVGA